VSIVIGPVLNCHGGYGFDVWAAANGLTRGFPYRRIEDAYYARITRGMPRSGHLHKAAPQPRSSVRHSTCLF
jgi:hypothetical protein